MILSMTGFATATVQITIPKNNEKIILDISLKSLNSRFFELTCKLPSILQNIEIPVQRNLQKQLHRGHVFLHVKIVNSELLNESVTPSLHTIDNYLQAIALIQSKFHFKDEVTLQQILQLPNTLQSKEATLDTETESYIMQAISDLGLQLIKTQLQEGAQLVYDIKEQLASMVIKIAQIQKLSQELIVEKKQLLTTLISKIAEFDTTIEPKSAEQSLLEVKKSNLMYEIEKIDINEETVRFNSHLTNTYQQLETQDPVKGKKIDFIIQELNREINTIAAKCCHMTISSLAIDIKSELEKAREQVQNII